MVLEGEKIRRGEEKEAQRKRGRKVGRRRKEGGREGGRRWDRRKEHSWTPGTEGSRRRCHSLNTYCLSKWL